VELQCLDLLSPTDFEPHSKHEQRPGRRHPYAGDGTFGQFAAEKVTDLAGRSRLPGMYYSSEFVEVGG